MALRIVDASCLSVSRHSLSVRMKMLFELSTHARARSFLLNGEPCGWYRYEEVGVVCKVCKW